MILEAERMFSTADLLAVWCVEQTGEVEIFETLGFNVVERVALSDSSNDKEIEVCFE